jgi:F0F1-type ATP synthase membrane subunit c/vacuolar-type H+-ATPase subunit K
MRFFARQNPRRLAAVLLLVALAAAGAALAQCPMCGQAAEQAGASPAAARRTLLQGVFLLLVPAFSILGAVTALVMRYVKADRQNAR